MLLLLLVIAGTSTTSSNAWVDSDGIAITDSDGEEILL